jgi:transposase
VGLPTVEGSGSARDGSEPEARPADCRIEKEARGVWIQAAHSLVPSRQPSAAPLQKWFWTVARRRGVRTAMVAFARKMLSLAFYLLRDRTQYEPLRLRQAAA